MATHRNTTFDWPGKPVLDTTPSSVVAMDFASVLDKLERTQKLEAQNAVTPFSLKEADRIDERWHELTRQTSPTSAGLPTRLGDSFLLQARTLLHLSIQLTDADDHAAIAAAFYDLTQAAADRVPPRIYSLLERALTDVVDGYFPMVRPSDSLTPRA